MSDVTKYDMSKRQYLVSACCWVQPHDQSFTSLVDTWKAVDECVVQYMFKYQMVSVQNYSFILVIVFASMWLGSFL